MAQLEIEIRLIYVGFPTNLETCKCCEDVIYSKVYKQAIRYLHNIQFTGINLCESCFEALKTI